MAPGPERLHCMAISIIMNSRLCPNYILHLTKLKNQIFCIETSPLSLQDQVSRLDKDFHDSSKNISNTHMKILQVLKDWTSSTPTLPRVAYLYSFFVQRGRCLHGVYFPLISRQLESNVVCRCFKRISIKRRINQTGGLNMWDAIYRGGWRGSCPHAPVENMIMLKNLFAKS